MQSCETVQVHGQVGADTHTRDLERRSRAPTRLPTSAGRGRDLPTLENRRQMKRSAAKVRFEKCPSPPLPLPGPEGSSQASFHKAGRLLGQRRQDWLCTSAPAAGFCPARGGADGFGTTRPGKGRPLTMMPDSPGAAHSRPELPGQNGRAHPGTQIGWFPSAAQSSATVGGRPIHGDVRDRTFAVRGRERIVPQWPCLRLKNRTQNGRLTTVSPGLCGGTNGGLDAAVREVVESRGLCATGVSRVPADGLCLFAAPSGMRLRPHRRGSQPRMADPRLSGPRASGCMLQIRAAASSDSRLRLWLLPL